MMRIGVQLKCARCGKVSEPYFTAVSVEVDSDSDSLGNVTQRTWLEPDTLPEGWDQRPGYYSAPNYTCEECTA